MHCWGRIKCIIMFIDILTQIFIQERDSVDDFL